MGCKICGNPTSLIFNKKLNNKYDINFFQCNNCDFIQTEEPFWLKEIYKNPISINDTGLLSRNIYLSRITSLIINLYFNIKDSFLDFGGGYGLLTRLMRDKKFNYFWIDPYSTNIFSKEFEWNNKQEISLVTCFESFEHFVEPVIEIEKILKISKSILFTTELVPLKNIESWWYLGTEHGQHVSFYSLKSLQLIAEKNNLSLFSDGKSIHMFSPKSKKININLIKFIERLNFNVEKILNKLK